MNISCVEYLDNKVLDPYNTIVVDRSGNDESCFHQSPLIIIDSMMRAREEFFNSHNILHGEDGSKYIIPRAQEDIDIKLTMLRHLYNSDIVVVEKREKDLLYNVSKKYPLIFVHLPKTAGTSINDVLDVEVQGHRTLKEIKLLLDKSIYNSYKKISVVRNPYDRMVSLYKSTLPIVMKNARENNYVGDDFTFEDWFWNIYNHINNIAHEPLYGAPCYDSMVGDSNKLSIDYILRFENLEEDWNDMFNDLNLKVPELLRLNTTKHEHYSKYYQYQTGEMMINFIYEIFKKDFDTFGYEFEEKA